MTVELEDLTQQGPERRVDTHNLVIFLGKLTNEVRELRERFDEHLETEKALAAAEQKTQEEITALLSVLRSFKVTLGFLKYLAGIGAALAALTHWGAPVINWFKGRG